VDSILDLAKALEPMSGRCDGTPDSPFPYTQRLTGEKTLAAMRDAKTWRVIDADASVKGPVVRLKLHGDPAVGSNIGLALVQNVKFSEGTLEIDLRGAGKQDASVLGVASASRTPRPSKLCAFVGSDSQTTTRTRSVTRYSTSRGLSTRGRSRARTSLAVTKPPSSPFRIPPGGFTLALK
jgi:hypothetical protein